ncbi:hypothetical protein [Azospirillum sp. ST 5-10]|uniref:hypothetical protein n=1 Tax=unclassified Azospirillum TaxID=2630922 RepID=UPI003F4A6E34
MGDKNDQVIAAALAILVPTIVGSFLVMVFTSLISGIMFGQFIPFPIEDVVLFGASDGSNGQAFIAIIQSISDGTMSLMVAIFAALGFCIFSLRSSFERIPIIGFSISLFCVFSGVICLFFAIETKIYAAIQAESGQYAIDRIQPVINLQLIFLLYAGLYFFALVFMLLRADSGGEAIR